MQLAKLKAYIHTVLLSNAVSSSIISSLYQCDRFIYVLIICISASYDSKEPIYNIWLTPTSVKLVLSMLDCSKRLISYKCVQLTSRQVQKLWKLTRIALIT